MDARYASMAAALPAGGLVGWVSDRPVGELEWSRIHTRCQYALIPRLLVFDGRPEMVVADLADPARLPEVAARHGLEVVRVFEGGVALCRRRVGGR